MDELGNQSLSLTLQIDLPQELITNEILTRLPVKSLIRFKCVSNEWRSIISSPVFSRSHQQSLFIKNSVASYYAFDYSGFDSGLIILCESDFEIDDDNSPFGKKGVDDVELPSELAAEIYHPEGDTSLHNLNIWNPITRELRRVQRPPSFPKKQTLWGFGHVSSMDDYKIVGLSQEMDCARKKPHVVGLRDESRREVNVLEGYTIETRSPGIFVDQMVFWCMLNRFSVLCLVGFDLVGETFREVEVPEWIQSLGDYELSVIGGRLCVWRESEGILTIGMM